MIPSGISRLLGRIPYLVARKFDQSILSGLFFCCAPLLVFLAVLVLLGANPLRWVPLWNDEVGWFTQVNSVVDHFIPPGFIGYDETHAAIGTFGPWGAFTVYAMALFGKIFGWHYCSPLFMNVFYWMLANFVFLLFVRPGYRNALKLAALNCVLFLSIQYMFTGMSECTRFSMAIMLAGLFYYLLKDENRVSRRYSAILGIVAPTMLFFFVNGYLLFAFLLPFYGYAWFRYLNPARCRLLAFVALCAVLPSLFALVCFFIQLRTSAPCPGNTIQTYLKQPSIIALIRVIGNTIAANWKNANMSFVFENSKKWNGCVSSYLLFYYFILVVAAIRLVSSFKTCGKARILNVLVVCALSIFILAFLALYSTKSSWTYMRGLNVALVFSLYLVCMIDWPKLQLVLFGFAFMLFLPFSMAIRDDMTMRYLHRNQYGGGYDLFKKYSAVFSSKLVPCESKNGWDNTVACYGRSYNIGCAFPAGVSWNYIMDGHVVTKPRYIVTDITKNWHFNGYKKTYSDDLICIFEKQERESEK